MSFASLCAFTYAYPVSFLSKCHAKNCKEVLCAFIVQPQRSSCGFQDSSSSDPQSAARRTSSCGRKKKFLRVHYFWAVLYKCASNFFPYQTWLTLSKAKRCQHPALEQDKFCSNRFMCHDLKEKNHHANLISL